MTVPPGGDSQLAPGGWRLAAQGQCGDAATSVLLGSRHATLWPEIVDGRVDGQRASSYGVPVRPRQVTALSLVLILAFVTVILVLVMLAAHDSPQRVFEGTLRDPNYSPPTPTYSESPLQGPVGRGRGHLSNRTSLAALVGGLITVLFLAVAFVLTVLMVALILRGARRALARSMRHTDPQRMQFEVLDDALNVADHIRQDSALQSDLLQTGTPRNAIVSCWDRFERHAERLRVPREPWETATEFVRRMLDQAATDQAAVTQLEGLYQEARFSDHPVDESSRQAAAAALQRIHDSLRLVNP